MWSLLSPSEIVVLHAERFAPPPRPLAPRWQAPISGARVSASHLAIAALLSSVAALHEAGVIELRVDRRRALLGLRTVRSLVVAPAFQTVGWPGGSIEAAMAGVAAAGEVEASVLVVRALAEDSFDPWNHTLDRIVEGLVRRGVIEGDDDGDPETPSSRRYHLTEATHAGIRDEECEDALAALHRFCARHAEAAGMFTDAVRTAMEARASTVEPQPI